MSKKKTTKVLFGRVAMIRMVCPRCGEEALASGGKMLCCGTPARNPKSYQHVKRVAEGEDRRHPLRKKEKQAIIVGQDGCCFYCGLRFGDVIWHPKRNKPFMPRIEFDHLICWSYSKDSEVGNFVAACSTCNRIKGDKLFDNSDQARIFVRDRRLRKGFDVFPITFNLPTVFGDIPRLKTQPGASGESFQAGNLPISGVANDGRNSLVRNQ